MAAKHAAIDFVTPAAPLVEDEDPQGFTGLGAWAR
jgi:hypothetical protein